MRDRPAFASPPSLSVLTGVETSERMTRSVVPFGVPELDEVLQGGLARASVHEVYAEGEADAAATTGLALAFALRLGGTRPLVWVRQAFVDAETGRPHLPGLVELGLDPLMITLVSAHDARGVLQAGLEGARCASLGAVVIELWGETNLLDLTASRRLALAARDSGVTVCLARIASAPQPSAAETRWRVRAAPSRALLANAPGDPVFSITLLRHRNGAAGRQWYLEWNRDRACFEDRTVVRRPGSAASLSGPVVPVPAERADAAGADRAGQAGPTFRRAG